MAFAPALGVVLAFAVAPAAANCTLELTGARSGARLLSVPLADGSARFALTFRHSVLGTPVRDEYEIRSGDIVLVEERVEGSGYGLPDSLPAGARRIAEGARTRVLLERPVSPLVVRPSFEQQTALVAGSTHLLSELDAGPILVTAAGCR